MRKARLIILVVVLLVLATGAGLFFLGYLGPKGGGILIETNPASSVFVDGVQVGRTPYQEVRKAEEISIKLVPDSFDIPLAPYETKVTLVPGVETIVRRNFAQTEEESEGEILTFEKVGGTGADLSIITTPESAQIVIDNTTRAFTPYKTSALEPGIHSVTVSAVGFNDRTLQVKTEKGFRLSVLVKLSRDLVEPEEEKPQEPIDEEEKLEILILSTPTGFLRVRSEPSTLAEEVGRVSPGEKYILLEEDEETGWFKIEFEEGKEGWVSGTYAEKLIEGEGEKTATDSATSTR